MESYHQEELSIFAPAPSDASLRTREWIEYRPINQLTDSATLEFNIPPQSSAYIDLKHCRLRLKIKLVHSDDSPIAATEKLALANLSLHTIFKQEDVSFQQTPLSHTGTNYPYKAYIDTILKTNESLQSTALQSQLFYK